MWTCDTCGMRCRDSEKLCPGCISDDRAAAWGFIQRVAGLNPNLGLMDIHALSDEANRLLREERRF